MCNSGESIGGRHDISACGRADLLSKVPELTSNEGTLTHCCLLHTMFIAIRADVHQFLEFTSVTYLLLCNVRSQSQLSTVHSVNFWQVAVTVTNVNKSN